MTITVNRKPVYFSANPKRVIVRFFMPGGPERAKKIIKRLMALSEEDTLKVLNQTLRDFSNRHRNITRVFAKNFDRVLSIAKEEGYDADNFSKERKLLMGAYFTHEYSIESAAFFNPSMVLDPDQANLEKGQTRIIVSFRATGEGHISSLEFRGGTLDKHNNLEFKQSGKLVEEAETIQVHIYNKPKFLEKLKDMHIDNPEVIDKILGRFGDNFYFRELRQSIAEYTHNNTITILEEQVLEAIKWIANAQYEITFSMDTAISERVIFPVSDTESNGIEDARFIKFTDDDGKVMYYGTYTAYNGFAIMPQLIETSDFYTFKVKPIYGKYAQNKGMALFPRKINGKYAMLSRNDGENNFIMFSDQLTNWNNEPILVQEPFFPWEFVQVGNSGSPIETPHGWLVITHAVGAMRRYCLGAIMLDKNDPTKVIGQLSEPLLVANEDEREGYVPNVVYSCGSIINNDEVIIPYAMSDCSSGFATVNVRELIEKMIPDAYAVDTTSIKKDAHKILLVDDDELSQLIVTDILTNEGYEVVVAADGLQAIMQISKHSFDLILSDISMPNFNGYQLLDFLNSGKIKIPVVFLTSHVSQEDEIKGLRMGAAEYLKKPVDAELLLLRIKNIIN